MMVHLDHIWIKWIGHSCDDNVSQSSPSGAGKIHRRKNVFGFAGTLPCEAKTELKFAAVNK